MLRLGEYQELKISRKKDFGIYLIDELTKEEVLLPKKEVPGGCGIGETLRVFLYLDSEDRPVATVEEPLLTMEKPAVLVVREVTRIGAFLDWGLPKDLFLPYKEMTKRVKAGEEALVRLYVDHSHRLAASMRKLYPLLSLHPPYAAGDKVKGRIYEFGHDFGTFVAVDDRYSGMIPRHEDVTSYSIGDIVEARITAVKEDGKLDLTLRDRAYLEIGKDAEHILSIIDSYGGVLPFTEAASPEVIRRETGLSKNAFKRAVGHLYKERIISLEQGKIRRIQS